ncbi:MAG: hypothetical protein H0V37_13955, partial [Chloroflexia bacterium]|nr:hypothetical protein [Chloroflexia bacterium]
MNTTTPIHRFLATALFFLFGMVWAQPATSAVAQATPAASPVASPVAGTDGCDGLGAYFQQLADLALQNEGLVLMRAVGFDALALTEEEAATVVRSLDDLILELGKIEAPDPARLYHTAYIEMVAWYRALAADRDEASHQRLINDDRRIFILM